MSDALLVYDTEQHDPNSEGGKLARQTVNNMKTPVWLLRQMC